MLGVRFVLLVILSFIIPNLAMAATNEAAKDKEIESLKGITSLKYACVYDPDYKLIKIVSTELSKIDVPTKSVDLKDDAKTPLNSTEARLKVVVDDRKDQESWVGLYVQQKATLDRNRSVACEAETYKIGTLCPRDKVDSAVKNLCAQFANDFAMAAEVSKAGNSKPQ
jgi:hypothetical protein